MISFEPSEDQQLILGTVADFAKSALLPRARKFEAAREVCAEVRSAIQEMALGAAGVPESLGGQGLGLLTAVMINEELAYGDAAAPFGLPSFGPFTLAALELGNDAQQAALLGPLLEAAAFGAVAWSEAQPNRDRPGFVTVAKPAGDGFELSGAKSFVSNAAVADQFVVFAQVDAAQGWNGIGAFIVKQGAKGLEVTGRHETLGLACANFGQVKLDRVAVGKTERLLGSGDFAAATIRFFAKYSLTIAARQVGLARAAFDLTREYCDMRTAFGKPIGHFQAVAFNLADRHMDIESARELVRRAAWSFDAEKDEKRCLLATAQAVAHAHEVAMRTTDDAVQLHGGAGFMRDVIVEKMMRDARQMALSGMTTAQMDQLAALLLTDQALDPAVVLPTPETQSVFT